MKIVVIGAGAVGSVLCRLLAQDKRVERVICCDIRKTEFNNKKIEFRIMNVLDKANFIRFLKKENPDVVINVSLPKFNLNIMEACAEAKVNYLDTCSFWALDKNPRAKIPYKMEQLDYNKEFLKNDITGLINSGVAPGTDNLLVAEASSKLDEIDYIKIRMVEDTGSKEIFFSWNKDWLLDELNSPPLIYENGKFKLAEKFGAEEEYEFPAPIGKRKTYYFAQDEAGSIPLYIKTKKLDVKIHDNNIDVSKLLVALNLTSDKEIKVNGMNIKPINFLSKILPEQIPGEEKRFPNSIFAIAVEAIGKKDGKKKSVKYSVIFPYQKEIGKMNIGANFISYPTALSAKLFAMIMPKIKKKGVFPPEALDSNIRKEVLEELKKHCKVSLKIS